MNVIYTMYPNCKPDIMILAQAILQWYFVDKVALLYKMPKSEKGANSAKYFLKNAINLSGHLPLGTHPGHWSNVDKSKMVDLHHPIYSLFTIYEGLSVYMLQSPCKKKMFI